MKITIEIRPCDNTWETAAEILEQIRQDVVATDEVDVKISYVERKNYPKENST